jgi:hypothetical protein
MNLRPLIVGMSNPRSADPAHALYPWPRGCAGNRLYEMLRGENPSVTMSGYVRLFERVNLVSGIWNVQRAHVAAKSLWSTLSDRSAVLLGREVARAFGFVPSSRWYKADVIADCHHVEGVDYYLLPHPSGRNLRYNDPEVRRAAGQVLARLYEIIG